MSAKRPIGIDLGTTHTAVATLDESGRTVMVPNAEGEILTPSVIFFDDDQLIVGKNARAAASALPDRVVRWIGRDLGRNASACPVDGRSIQPEVAAAAVLRKLKEDIVEPLGAEPTAVLTVPGCLGESARASLVSAAQLAGIDVVGVCDAPTAIATAYGEFHGYLTEDGPFNRETTVMTIDLGGGKFDASILRIAPAKIETLAAVGDARLGGANWDARLVRMLCEQFREQHGMDPRDDPASVARLLTSAAEAKQTLGARSKTSVRVDYRGMTSEIEITRDEYQSLTADLVARLEAVIQSALAEAQLDWPNIARIFLVGGATRMPAVTDLIGRVTDIVPERSVNQDEAVARGAALLAAVRQVADQTGAPPPLTVVPRVSRSISFEKIEYEYDQVQERSIEYRRAIRLIDRGSPLPVSQSRRFATEQDQQREIVVDLFEGESEWSTECDPLGRVIVSDLPEGVSVGWPAEVTLTLDEGGQLTVRAEVPGTHRDMTFDLQREAGLDEAAIAAWTAALEAGGAVGTVTPLLGGQQESRIPIGLEDLTSSGTIARQPAVEEAPQAASAADESTQPADAPEGDAQESTEQQPAAEAPPQQQQQIPQPPEPPAAPTYAPTYAGDKPKKTKKPKPEKSDKEDDESMRTLITLGATAGIYLAATVLGLTIGYVVLKAMGIDIF